MTEQQACTLCGMEGHTPAQCIWNGNEKALALVQEIDKRNAARSAQAQPSPAPELERPIAVAYRSSESGNLYEEHYGLKDPEPLMTVAQHDRIRAQDAAQIDAAVALLAFTRGKLVKLKSERDAAQARVVELERQEPVATVCEVSMHHTGSTDVINTHLPCGTKLYANPAAQAGQVPEWIACEDRMPPVNENVLVTCEFTTNDWRIKVGGVDERGNWWVFGASWTPSHWQPLPAAPAQGGGE